MIATMGSVRFSTSTGEDTRIISSVAGSTVSFWANLASGSDPPPSITVADNCRTALLLETPTTDRYLLAIVQSYGLRMSAGGIMAAVGPHSWATSGAGYAVLGALCLYGISINYATGLVTFYRNGAYHSKSENPVWTAGASYATGCKTSESRAASSGDTDTQLGGPSGDYRVYRRELSAAEHKSLYFGNGGDSLYHGLSLRYTFIGRRTNNAGGNNQHKNHGGVYVAGTPTWGSTTPWVGGPMAPRPPRRR